MAKVIYVDMDGVLADYQSAFHMAIEANPKIQFPQSQYGFFQNLQPIDGGLTSINLLDSSDEFDVYILSAPSIHNPLCYTEKRVWVENHLGMDFVSKLIISPDKSLNRGDFLIDDHISGRGQERFQGELIHFGSSDFPDWTSVLKYFSSYSIR